MTDCWKHLAKCFCKIRNFSFFYIRKEMRAEKSATASLFLYSMYPVLINTDKLFFMRFFENYKFTCHEVNNCHNDIRNQLPNKAVPF